MFAKLSAIALLVPFVSGLTLNTPTNVNSGGQATITWTSSSSDTTFSLELVNNAFHNAFAIANNVQPGSNTITINLPIVPVGDGYTLEAVNVSNIDDVYATSSGFSVGATVSSSSSASASSTGSATSSSGSASGSASGSSSAASASSTSPSSASGSGSGSASSASSSATTGSSLNGAPSFKAAGSLGAMALAAVAGVALVVM